MPKDILLQTEKTGSIPKEQTDIILKDFMTQSVVSQLATYEPMTKPEKTFTFLAEGPGAYWVGEGEKIKTSKAKWLTAKMISKKLAVIIPMSKEFLKYSVPDAFSELRDPISAAFATAIDKAALFGEESPFEAGVSLFERATASDNVVESTDDVYGNLNELISDVEDGDKDPNGIVTTKSFKNAMRGARDTTGLPIFNEATAGAASEALGLPIAYANRASFDKEKAVAFAGAWDYARFGVLQGIEYSVSEEATLSTILNEDGTDINLWEQDLVGLKVTMQVGFTTLSEDAFAALKPSKVTAKSAKKAD